VKKLSITVILATIVIASAAQNQPRLNGDSAGTSHRKTNEKKDARRQKISNLIRQAEEGVLVYRKQSIIGLQARNNGYGLFYELGRMKTTRKTNIYRLDITEIKHPKEEKQTSGGPSGIFNNPFIYGKINSFYQLTLGFGQQYMLGQKGNKNGVAISAVYSGGLALGFLRPYYLEVHDPNRGDNLIIKYSQKDSALFLDQLGLNSIVGGGGFGKGWGELKIKPGGFLKTALRFDYGRFNELVSGIEIGISGEFYASKIPILFGQKDKQFFFQGYIAVLFGRRK
jgi:hypothetical protein